MNSPGVNEINAANVGVSNGEVSRVPAVFFLKNEGPDVVLLTPVGSGFGSDDGYPIEPGEHFKIGYVGSIFVRCPSASSSNINSVVFITSNVIA